LFVTQPLFIVTPEYENTDKFIEDEDTISADQVIFFVGNVTINGTYTVLGEMVIL